MTATGYRDQDLIYLYPKTNDGAGVIKGSKAQWVGVAYSCLSYSWPRDLVEISSGE